MPGENNEVQALQQQIAALTSRVFALERALGQAREHQLEQRQEILPRSNELPREPAAPVGTLKPEYPAPVHIPPAPSQPSPMFNMSASQFGSIDRELEPNLEKKIGQYWLNRIGILAVLIGAAYFLKLAFDNHWIGETGRIVIGLLAGSGLIVWSERFRSRGHNAFSYSLKAIGIGTLYLSLWAAFQLYHLIPPGVAFAAMIVVTAATITFSLTQNSQLLAAFALLGGFSTPILVSTGENHEAVLLTYVAILDVGILVMAWLRPWRRLVWGSFIGTAILFMGWFFSYYNREERPLTVFFAALLFGIFAAIPLITRVTALGRASVTRTALPLLNAATLFLLLYAMYADETATLTWYCLALAAAYLFIGKAIQARSSEEDRDILKLLHLAIAIVFITVAIPLKLQAYAGYWITIGWLVESAALLWVATRTRLELLGYFAAGALVLGIFRLLVLDEFGTHALLWNARFATYLLAIAIMAAIAKYAGRFSDTQAVAAVQAAGVLANVLALIALTLEARDYFQQQITESYVRNQGLHDLHDFVLARDFTYSAIWLVYGAALMAAGFWKRSAFLRWQSLVLIGITIVKVFVYDVSELQQAYRVVSFIALGGVLLGISFVYQRDWLKLSAAGAPDVPPDSQGSST
jgi:uncharacterized membrane protein